MHIRRSKANVYHVLLGQNEPYDILERAKACLKGSRFTKDEVTKMKLVEVSGPNSATTETALEVTISPDSRMGLTAIDIASVLEEEGGFSCPQLNG